MPNCREYFCVVSFCNEKILWKKKKTNSNNLNNKRDPFGAPIWEGPRPDFTNILQAAFTLTDPKSAKRLWWLDCLYALLGKAGEINPGLLKVPQNPNLFSPIWSHSSKIWEWKNRKLIFHCHWRQFPYPVEYTSTVNLFSKYIYYFLNISLLATQS